MKDKLEKIFSSVRMRLIKAMLLSIICTLLTNTFILALFGGLSYVLGNKKQSNNTIYSEMGNNNTTTINSGVSTKDENVEAQYAPNELRTPEEKIYEFTFHIRRKGIISPHVIGDIIIMTVISVFFFIFYYILFTNKIVIYFKEINDGIDKIRGGDLNTVIPVRGDDELSETAQALNDMRQELKKSMVKERENEQLKNQLVTNVAHDLRTPLTSIVGYLELLNSDEYIDEDVREKYTNTAYNKARTLEGLINELFDYTRFQKGKIKLNKQRLNITMFLQQLLAEFEFSMNEQGLKCVTDIPEKAVYIEGDGEKLARVFSNLISNAIKYGIDGKQIKVAMIELETQVYISITNYGRIIPQDKLPYVFDKFYRVEESRSTDTGGTGLGLAIAKNIVLMHDGQISAKSDDKGTVFTVCLNKEIS